jgi:hypothetical protein
MLKGIKFSILFFAIAAFLGAVTDADAKKGGKEKAAELKAALVPCAKVTQPGVLSSCGTDPETIPSNGKVEINKRGDIKISLAGAKPSVTYTAVYLSIDASELSIGTLTTDESGSGKLQIQGVFTVNDVGSGNIILRRDENGDSVAENQYVSGFRVVGEGGEADAEKEDEEEAKYEAGLVPCSQMNKPAIATCGADTLEEGKVEIDSEDGKIEVKVSKAAANATYQVVYRSLDGLTEVAIGTLATDSKGKGSLEEELFALDDVGSGNIILKRDTNGDGIVDALDLDQYVSGFRITETPVKAQKASFKAGLVPCAEINQPGALATCGVDTSFKGFAEINDKGDVKVVVVQAQSSTTYDVVYRSIDGTELPIGTMTTNTAGNGNLEEKKFFALNDAGAGIIVLKSAGLDQLMSGFKVAK